MPGSKAAGARWLLALVQARLEPIDFGSFEPPLARRFVFRQMELMEQGTECKEAFAQVEREFEAARQAA